MQILTLGEYLDLAIAAPRTVGVYPETKHPTCASLLASLLALSLQARPLACCALADRSMCTIHVYAELRCWHGKHRESIRSPCCLAGAVIDKHITCLHAYMQPAWGQHVQLNQTSVWCTFAPENPRKHLQRASALGLAP